MKDIVFPLDMTKKYPYKKDTEPKDERKTLADYINDEKGGENEG